MKYWVNPEWIEKARSICNAADSVTYYRVNYGSLTVRWTDGNFKRFADLESLVAALKTK